MVKSTKGAAGVEEWRRRYSHAKAGLSACGSLLREVAHEAMRDRINLLGAALAYYGIFSIGPLLFLVIQIAGLVYGVQLAEHEVLEQVREYAGATVSDTLQALIHATHRSGAGLVATWIGGATLVAGAASMFALIHDALNLIWGVAPFQTANPTARVIQAVEKYLIAITGIVVVGLLLLVSIVVGAILEAFHAPLDLTLPGGVGLWLSLNQVVPLGILTVAFGLMFRYVPDAVVSWRHAWLGALGTTLLIGIGKYALGVYLARSDVGLLYGVAGSLLALLVWIYYSAVSVFLGAELAKVTARRAGPRSVSDD
jgi:membrane protein